MRIPIQDVLDTRTRRRMEILCSLGHRFQVYQYGMPSPEEVDTLRQSADLIDRLELVIDWGTANILLPEIADLKHRTGTAIYLSRVNRKDTAKQSGGRYNHLISHGFALEKWTN